MGVLRLQKHLFEHNEQNVHHTRRSTRVCAVLYLIIPTAGTAVPYIRVPAILKYALVDALLVERLLVAIACEKLVYHRLHPVRHQAQRGFPRGLGFTQMGQIYERDEELGRDIAGGEG